MKEALANGRLANERDGEGYMTLEGIGRAHRPSPAPSVDAIAIAAALAQPWADVVLSGAVTVDQLRSNLTALDVHLRSDELTLMAAMAVQPEQYWLARSSLPWS